MTRKEWIILAGIALFLWWRNSARASSVTQQAAGTPIGVTPASDFAVGPPSAGNGALGTSSIMDYSGTDIPAMLQRIPVMLAGGRGN